MIQINNATLTADDEGTMILLDAALDLTEGEASFDIDMGEFQFNAEDCWQAADFFKGLALFLEMGQ